MPKTSKSTGITRDDWLSALAETNALRVDSDPSLLSYDEFAEMMGTGLATARRRLEALASAGRATRLTKRKIAADGHLRAVVAYRLTPKK